MSVEREGRLYRRNFDISFNELFDMFKDEELIIQPEFQRLFRWTETQQSLFIESLLLDMPIPPIYVDEQKDGSYILVDGLQRISSYLNFRGVELNTSTDLDEDISESAEYLEYYDEQYIADNSINPSFKLQGCEIRKDLNEKSFRDLSILDRRNLKRAFIRVEVLTKENEKPIKYHMFKRLNSGGSMLSEQELRNSNIRMIDERFINFINELSKNGHYKNLTKNMRIDDIKKMKRSENVLRYFLFKNKLLRDNIQRRGLRLEEDLTLYLEEVTEEKESFDYDTEKENFESLVEYLDQKFGPDIFGGVISGSDITTKKFIQYNFDGFMLYFSNESNRRENISQANILEIKRDVEYLNNRTGGIEKVKSRIDSIQRIIGE